jgi:hypothetical protein
MLCDAPADGQSSYPPSAQRGHRHTRETGSQVQVMTGSTSLQAPMVERHATSASDAAQRVFRETRLRVGQAPLGDGTRSSGVALDDETGDDAGGSRDRPSLAGSGSIRPPHAASTMPNIGANQRSLMSLQWPGGGRSVVFFTVKIPSRAPSKFEDARGLFAAARFPIGTAHRLGGPPRT